MINVKLLSTTFDNLKRRIVKVTGLGKNDTQTPIELSPFGVDSNPLKDMVAVMAKTEGTGDTYIVGYLLKDKLAAIGETRLFSTDEAGALKTYVWLRNDGKIELAGKADNLVRYKPLNDFTSELNQFLSTELAKIATGITAGGGSYTPGTPQFLLTDAKVDELLTT